MSDLESIRVPAFEVHLDAVMDVSVRLVNGLTGTWSRGRRMLSPEGDRRLETVATALAGDNRHRPSVSANEASEFLRTAGRLRTIFELVAEGSLSAAAVLVNDLMRETGARPELVERDDEGWGLHFRGEDTSLTLGWAAGCATGLAIAIGSDLGGRLGVCGASRCDQVFVDSSRNRVRRFCSLPCQNRTKSESYRRRR